jgi:23S rRNA (pseudouridine1915-N3)-methyltransferase
MLIRILAIGTKMPAWVNTGFQEYAKRFPLGWRFELCEIPAEKRMLHSDISQIISNEGEKILSAFKPNHRLIALDVKGQSWTTEQLAKQLQQWSQSKQNVDLVIGGPDGLSNDVLNKAEMRWSLSPLTLPHPLVRIILAEQLYRGLSILQNHPYHRG